MPAHQHFPSGSAMQPHTGLERPLHPLTLMTNGEKRRFAVGAEPSASGTHFRVWAPKCSRVQLVAREHSREYPLAAEGNGYFSGLIAELDVGACYQLKVDDDPRLYPDPATRFQPDGPHGTSQIVSGAGFEWRDAAFREATCARVVYELHVGTFTPEGTFRAAAAQCAELASLGITTLQLMRIPEALEQPFRNDLNARSEST